MQAIDSTIIKPSRTTIGSVSTCLVENCTGRYVDSIIGQYYVNCNDSKHKVEAGITSPSQMTRADTPTPRSLISTNE